MVCHLVSINAGCCLVFSDFYRKRGQFKPMVQTFKNFWFWKKLDNMGLFTNREVTEYFWSFCHIMVFKDKTWSNNGYLESFYSHPCSLCDGSYWKTMRSLGILQKFLVLKKKWQYGIVYKHRSDWILLVFLSHNGI